METKPLEIMGYYEVKSIPGDPPWPLGKFPIYGRKGDEIKQRRGYTILRGGSNEGLR